MGAAAESSVPKPKEPSITPEKPVAGVAVDTVGASEPLTNGSVGETELNTDEPPDPTQETIIAGGSPCQGAPKSMANGSADRMDDDAPIADVEDGAPENGDNKEGKGAQGENSEDDPFAGLNDVASMDIYELSNYTFGKKNEESKCKAMQQLPKAQIAAALRKNYEERGMRRSVGGILLVHAHNFPHVLLLQRSDGKGEYALPGGRLRPGESDDEGLRRKLDAKLKHPGLSDEEDQELEIGEKSTISISTPCIHTKAFHLLLFHCSSHVSSHILLTVVFFFASCLSQFAIGMQLTSSGGTTRTYPLT